MAIMIQIHASGEYYSQEIGHLPTTYYISSIMVELHTTFNDI